MYFGVEGCPEIFRRFCPNPAGGRGGKWEFHLPHFHRASPVVAACAQLATDPMCVRVKKNRKLSVAEAHQCDTLQPAVYM